MQKEFDNFHVSFNQYPICGACAETALVFFDGTETKYIVIYGDCFEELCEAAISGLTAAIEFASKHESVSAEFSNYG